MNERLIAAVEQVLAQGIGLLESLSNENYRVRLGQPHSASVGGHYRHVLDHLLCLQAGLMSGQVNYDLRNRDPRLQQDREYAIEVSTRLASAFSGISAEKSEEPVAVAYAVNYASPGLEWLTSTVGRELAFCTGHAIHHYAIIRLLCAEFDTKLPEHFGVAPSTLRHRQAHVAS
jgi:hypothetical protein